MRVKILAPIVGAMLVGSSAFAAGIDSRSYTCAALHNMVSANRYIYISNPTFKDFVVANVSYCGGGGSAILQLRSVPTIDGPECLVNYCGSHDFDNTVGGM